MIKNYKDYLITELINRKPAHGYELLMKINHEFEIKKITLYKTLERLERDNIIEVLKVEKRRKIYKVSDHGKIELEQKKNIYPEIANRKYTKIGSTIEHFQEIDSTNIYLKDNGYDLDDGHIVYADYQSLGRGRLARKWENERGQNVSMSVLVKPDVVIHEVPKITQVAAAAIWQTLSNYNVKAQIKWPNDIIVNDKKICGILVESKLNGMKADYVVVGMGLNVNTEVYPESIKDKAISLYQVTNEKYLIENVISNIIDSFELIYNQFINGNNSYLNICRENSYLLGREVTVNIDNSNLIVTVVDISENGQLLVDYNGEIIPLNISEITLENSYKTFDKS